MELEIIRIINCSDSNKIRLYFLNNDNKQHFSLFVFFLTFLPGLCVSIRRLHDIGKSGWWLLITLTGIGNILLLYWFILPSENGKNIYNKDGE